MQPRHRGRPGAAQICGLRCKARIISVEHFEVGAREGMLFDRDEVQMPAAGGIGLPGLPCHQEIQPNAETGFDDGEHVSTGPSRRQVIAVQENMLRLAGPGIPVVIDVAEFGGDRRAGDVERKRSGTDDRRHRLNMGCG